MTAKETIDKLDELLHDPRTNVRYAKVLRYWEKLKEAQAASNEQGEAS